MCACTCTDTWSCVLTAPIKGANKNGHVISSWLSLPHLRDLYNNRSRGKSMSMAERETGSRKVFGFWLSGLWAAWKARD